MSSVKSFSFTIAKIPLSDASVTLPVSVWSRDWNNSCKFDAYGPVNNCVKKPGNKTGKSSEKNNEIDGY